MLKFSMELCYPQLDVKTLSVGTGASHLCNEY
jgi:hypothetical protein